MGMLDALKGYKAKDNDAKPLMDGEFVTKVNELKQVKSKKTGKSWIILSCSVMRIVKAGEQNQIQLGEEITKMYNAEEDKDMKKFADDMFTAGIEIDYSTEESLAASMAAATDKLVYFNAWVKAKTPEQGEGFWNNVKIKSKNLITPELAMPKLSF